VIGYLAHEAIMCLVTSVSNVRLHGGVGVSFRKELLVDTVRVGLPITLLWWTLTLTGTVDRVVLGGLLGAKAVGYYFFGVSVAGLLALVPMVVGRVLYPKVSKQFGQASDFDSMKRLVLAPTMALGALLVNLQAVLLIAMPFVYDVLLPKYRPGLLAGEILLVGSFFGCLLRNGANYLIAANHERVFLKYIVATLIFNVVSDVSLVKLGLGIEGVALGTSLAGMFLTTLVWRRVFKGLGLKPIAARSALLGVYLPLILLLGGVGMVHLICPQALRVFGGASIAAGVALLACVNGLLCCFSLYRDEMAEWKKELWKIRAAFINRNRLAPADR
jgi:O-antigen/teichoic acid export membrane protein